MHEKPESPRNITWTLSDNKSTQEPSHLCGALATPVFTGGASTAPAGAPEVAAPGVAQSGSPYAILVNFDRDYN